MKRLVLFLLFYNLILITSSSVLLSSQPRVLEIFNCAIIDRKENDRYKICMSFIEDLGCARRSIARALKASKKFLPIAKFAVPDKVESLIAAMKKSEELRSDLFSESRKFSEFMNKYKSTSSESFEKDLYRFKHILSFITGENGIPSIEKELNEIMGLKSLVDENNLKQESKARLIAEENEKLRKIKQRGFEL